MCLSSAVIAKGRFTKIKCYQTSSHSSCGIRKLSVKHLLKNIILAPIVSCSQLRRPTICIAFAMQSACARVKWRELEEKKKSLLINALCFMYFVFADKIQTLVVLWSTRYVEGFSLWLLLLLLLLSFDDIAAIRFVEIYVLPSAWVWKEQKTSIELKLKMPFIIYSDINIE